MRRANEAGPKFVPGVAPGELGVIAFLPGHVLSGADRNRLLDLLDFAHFAAFTRGNELDYDQISRIHPMKATSEGLVKSGYRTDGSAAPLQARAAFANYSKFIARLLDFCKEVGIDVRKLQERADKPLRLWLPDPQAVKERATELLEELEIQEEERHPRLAARRRAEDEGPFMIEVGGAPDPADPEFDPAEEDVS